MTREQRIAIAVTAAAAGAVGIYLSTGTMPAPAPGATAWRALAVGPCEVAQELAADPGVVDCAPGETVYTEVEVLADTSPDASSVLDWSLTRPTCPQGMTIEERRVTDGYSKKHGSYLGSLDGGFVASAPVPNYVIEYRCTTSLPPGMLALPGRLRSAPAVHPDRALTVLGPGDDWCLAGEVRRRTSSPDAGTQTYWTPRGGVGQCCGDACECAGVRCARVCPPQVYAGSDPCREIICRRWPALCDGGAQ